MCAGQVRQDARATRLGYAADFEWLNRQLFFEQYGRIVVYFTNSDLGHDGVDS